MIRCIWRERERNGTACENIQIEEPVNKVWPALGVFLIIHQMHLCITAYREGKQLNKGGKIDITIAKKKWKLLLRDFHHSFISYLLKKTKICPRAPHTHAYRILQLQPNVNFLISTIIGVKFYSHDQFKYLFGVIECCDHQIAHL